MKKIRCCRSHSGNKGPNDISILHIIILLTLGALETEAHIFYERSVMYHSYTV